MLNKAGDGLTWMASAGGPLLLVPGEHLPFWEGIWPPTRGRRVKAKFRWDDPSAPATDYDRACDVEGYLGVLDIGDGQGLVLGDEPAATAWWTSPSLDAGATCTEGILIRWIYANNEAEVIHAVEHVPEGAWSAEEVVLRVGQEPLYLIDSAIEGKALKENDHLTIHLQAGHYSVATGVHEPDTHTSLILHRLKLVGTSVGSERT